jgi:hypothetical protein
MLGQSQADSRRSRGRHFAIGGNATYEERGGVRPSGLGRG